LEQSNKNSVHQIQNRILTMSTHNIEKTLQQQEAELRQNDPDLREEGGGNIVSEVASPDFDKASLSTSTKPFKFIPLGMGGGGRTHVVSEGSRRLIEEEVSLADLQKMTELFYEKAFQDATLDKFIRSHTDPHGARFAKWIHQKLSDSSVWDQDRYSRNSEPVQLAGGHHHVVHDRSSAHVAAWYSPKRPSHEVGRHFKLDECRVWMRLHFWAMRESGIMEKSPSFADYYLRFISHFVKVYEGSAPAYARESLRWSERSHNISTYLSNGRKMVDVLGLTQDQARAQLPRNEAMDTQWPYNI
jgi:hypothetical protein